jgi:hypothetical protein
MPEQTLEQGEIIIIQFDRQTAVLGLELTQESGLHDGIPGLALVAPRQNLDEDFSAGAYVLEFLVSTASGVAATAVTALVSKVLSERGKRKGLSIVVIPLPSAPEDDSLRLGIICKEQVGDQP